MDTALTLIFTAAGALAITSIVVSTRRALKFARETADELATLDDDADKCSCETLLDINCPVHGLYREVTSCPEFYVIPADKAFNPDTDEFVRLPGTCDMCDGFLQHAADCPGTILQQLMAGHDDEGEPLTQTPPNIGGDGHPTYSGPNYTPAEDIAAEMKMLAHWRRPEAEGSGE